VIRRGSGWAGVAGLLSLLSLLIAFGVQTPCLVSAGRKTTGRTGCFSDVWSLYRLRDLRTHTFPYLHVGAFGFPRGTLEYPTLTGIFGWVCALPVGHPLGFFLITSAVLGVVAVATAIALGRAVGAAAYWFALSPALAVHAFQNWDLLPVAATVLGALAWWRGRRTTSAAWFAVGACLKIWPGFFLIALVADALQRKDRREAGRAVAAAAAVVLVTNGPFIALAPRAWWQVWTFQQQRPIDISAMSIWSVFAQQLTIPLANFGAAVTGLIGVLVVLYLGSARAAREGTYPTLPVGAAMVIVFVVTQKACSPQDMLWLAPLFALVRVRARWFALLAVVDLASSAAIYWVLYNHPAVQSTTQSLSVTVAVLVRAALLVVLVPVFAAAQPRAALTVTPAAEPAQATPTGAG
jgi:uncharacterized membrane protein